MRKFLSAFILIILVFSADIFGQSELSGFVSSKNDSKKIANVNVLIPVLNLGTVTNSEGYYEFKSLPVGYYQVQFSYVGYKAVVSDINLVDGSNKLNVELIVLGSKGTSAFGHYLLGSVANKVVQYAHKPVMVVR